MVKDIYAQLWTPSQDLSVDETFLKFYGRFYGNQYMPKKPSAKWGIKIWSLCDPRAGYLLNFEVYTGKEQNPQQERGGLGATVTHTLLKGYENKGHHVYMDNYFSSIPLFEDLRDKGIGACATVKTNKKYLPKEMRNSKLKLKKGEAPISWVNKDKSIIASTWQDSGRVNMISTVGDSGITKKTVNNKRGAKERTREVQKPNINVMYNKKHGRS